VAKSQSVKQRLRKFFLDNIGRVITSRELSEVASPASEWARRVRELRDEEGWPILTHNDTTKLKPGEYLLETKPTARPDVVFQRNISQKLRAEVLDRNGFTCQMCGLTPSDVDPITGRRTRLHIGHIVDKSLGGKDEASNLRTLCSTCNQGAKNITSEKPSALWLLSQVRRANLDDQRAVLDWLAKKFS
jgi:hypothetical protein